MKKPVLNLDQLEYRDWSHGERFAGRMGSIARELGAEKLGYNLTVVPAGKRAFPFHSHRVIEEMFFILEGEGELRIGEERHPLRAGDVVCCPAGGPETAHQIINTMETGEIRYLAVSSNESPDICEYPDSGKKLVAHYRPKGAGAEGDDLRLILGEGEGQAGYWEGE